MDNKNRPRDKCEWAIVAEVKRRRLAQFPDHPAYDDSRKWWAATPLEFFIPLALRDIRSHRRGLPV